MAIALTRQLCSKCYTEKGMHTTIKFSQVSEELKKWQKALRFKIANSGAFGRLHSILRYILSMIVMLKSSDFHLIIKLIAKTKKNLLFLNWYVSFKKKQCFNKKEEEDVQILFNCHER